MHCSSLLFAPLLVLAQQVTAHAVPLTKPRHAHLQTATGHANVTAILLDVHAARVKFGTNAENLLRNLKTGAAGGLVKRKHKHARAAPKTAVALLAPQGSLWTGPVEIGTPARTFQMDFDTGSTDTILCGASACNDGHRRRTYSHAQSKTAKASSTHFSNYYGDGSTTTGTIVTDTVRFGGLVATTQVLNVATQMGGSLLTANADGLMGFAFAALSSDPKGVAVDFTLSAEKAQKINEFAFRLSSKAGVSELFMGGYNPAKMTGAIAYYPMATDPVQPGVYTYFQIANSVARANGKKVAGTTASYIIDTGTTLILAPVASAKTFWAAVPGAKPTSQTGMWSFPCATPPTVSFSFGGSAQVHTVAPEDLSLGTVVGSPTQCYGAVVGADSGVGTSWIMGDSFLKNQYTIFDVTNKRIGFATPV